MPVPEPGCLRLEECGELGAVFEDRKPGPAGGRIAPTIENRSFGRSPDEAFVLQEAAQVRPVLSIEVTRVMRAALPEAYFLELLLLLGRIGRRVGRNNSYFCAHLVQSHGGKDTTEIGRAA